MTNWVMNVIEIKGKAKHVRNVIKAIKSLDFKSGIDFNRIIPQPECIMNTPGHGVLAETARAFYNSAKKAKKDPIVMLKNGYLTKEMQKQKENWDKTRDACKIGQKEDNLSENEYWGSYLDLMLNYLECIKQTCCVDWYDWRQKNWGTKWNACKSEVSGNIVNFLTANSAPRPIFIAMAQKFPDITFFVSVKYLEPPVMFFFIEYKYDRKKKIVKEKVINGWQEEETDREDD